MKASNLGMTEFEREQYLSRPRPVFPGIFEFFGATLAALFMMTVLVSNLTVSSVDAKSSRVEADFKAIKTAIRIFKIDTGRYPRCLCELSKQDQVSGKGPWIEERIQDPWGHEYYYEYRSGGKYVIMSFGADGLPGGEGENQDLAPPKWENS